MSVIANMPADSLSPREVLTLLLTTEALLSAAFGITVGLSASSTFGPKTIVPPWTLAIAAAVVLASVAVGAVFAWADLFGGSSWPGSTSGKVEALALLLAILAQPILSFVVALGIWRG